MLDALLAGRSRRRRRRAAHRPRPLGRRARREPARRRRCARSSSTPGRIARLHLRTGSYANWPPLAHAVRRQPPARLPADQQELRALLRLRGPLTVRPAPPPAPSSRRSRQPAPARGPRLAGAAPRRLPAPATAASTSSPPPPTRYYDLQRFGLNIVASPRHADVLLVTGPVTTRMAGPLRAPTTAMPEPRLVAALGDCALGCDVLGERSRARRRAGRAAARRHPHPWLPADSGSTIAEHLLAGLDAL